MVLTDQSEKMIWDEIKTAWKFDPPKLLDKFLGIVCKMFPEHGYRYMVLDQTDLVKKIVDDYQRASNRTIATRVTLPQHVPPMVDQSDPDHNVTEEKGDSLHESAPHPLPQGAQTDDESGVSEDEHMAQAARAAGVPYTESKAKDGWIPTTSPLTFVSPIPDHYWLDDREPPAMMERAAYGAARKKKPTLPKPDGEGGTTVRSVVGGLFYAARGTRMDIMKGTHEMARRVTKWTEPCTEFMEHLLGYAITKSAGIVLDARGCPSDLDQWTMDLSTDARYHAPYSTTGIVLCLAPTDPNISRFLPLDWTSHAQRYVKLNVAESEVVSAVHGMGSGLRYQASWSLMTGGHWDWALEGEEPRQCDQLRQRQDNTACILQLERGWSEKMSLLPVLYGVSAGWASERIREKRVNVQHEKTKDMIADPLTKMTPPNVLFERGLLVRLS